ncbi:hypothetical protein OIE66_09700 [Nonomuraea sp. NBC_01738]|uniref:hypothetical protein n=1 Tax=Nonomuraea sp. NBC_01738 TaxID=2976003 RepID=UPI002E128FDC|nr:hypothetical protein OIE66_09700 [Nonomuraea sp. NBC_01738]
MAFAATGVGAGTGRGGGGRFAHRRGGGPLRQRLLHGGGVGIGGLALDGPGSALASGDRATGAETALFRIAAYVGPELLVLVVGVRVAPLVDATFATLTRAHRSRLLHFVYGAEVRAEVVHPGLMRHELIGRAGLGHLLTLGHRLEPLRRKRTLPAVHRTHAQCHDDEHEEHDSDQADYDRDHCTTLKAMASQRRR